MSGFRLSLLLICVSTLSMFGGCIFDSEGDADCRQYGISGYVRDDEEKPFDNVKITAFFNPREGVDPAPDCSTRTNSRGYYRICFDAAVHELILIPSKHDCVFRPYSIAYRNPSGSLRSENFTGYCGETYSIAGHVHDSVGEPVVQVAIGIRDQYNRWNITVYTDKSGYYLIDDLVPGLDYVLTPTRAFYHFSPPSRAYEDLGESHTDQNFTALPDVHG